MIFDTSEIKFKKLPSKICKFLQPVTLRLFRIVCIFLTSTNFFLLMYGCNEDNKCKTLIFF